MDDLASSVMASRRPCCSCSEPAALCLSDLSHRDPDRRPDRSGRAGQPLGAGGHARRRDLGCAHRLRRAHGRTAAGRCWPFLGEVVAPLAEQAAVQGAALSSGEVTQRTPRGFWAMEVSYVNIREIFRAPACAISPSTNRRNRPWSRHPRRRRHYRMATGCWRASPAVASPTRASRSNARQRPGLRCSIPPCCGWWWWIPGAPGLGLARYVRYMTANGQDAGEYETEMWTKITIPS